MTGYCNGIGCNFTWPRDDDWKYFTGTVRFANEAEYEKAWEEAY